jgi:hypothetical protein
MKATAKFFSGRGVETLSVRVDSDGTVRVYDDVAGYYTICHALSSRVQRRIAREVWAATPRPAVDWAATPRPAVDWDAE